MNLKLAIFVLISCLSLVAFDAPFGEMEIKIRLYNWIWIAMICVRGTRLRLGAFRGHYPLMLNAFNLLALGLYLVPSYYGFKYYGQSQNPTVSEILNLILLACLGLSCEAVMDSL